MARYVARVATPWPAEKAFAYMADLNNFASWDPGVRSVAQTEGSGGGPDSVFDLTIAGGLRDIVLTYRTVEYDAPREFLVVARSSLLTSEDRIRVTPDGGGSIVEYDAQLRLNGALGPFDLALRPFFDRIGGRAAKGLRTALEGTEG